MFGVALRSKTAVVALEKKCLPDGMRLAGKMLALASDGRPYSRATVGRISRRSGYKAAVHDALKRLATAPSGTGVVCAFCAEHE